MAVAEHSHGVPRTLIQIQSVRFVLLGLAFLSLFWEPEAIHAPF